MEKTNLELLTELQNKIGYTPGDIHPVALLGLMGECGEVAMETTFANADNTPTNILGDISTVCYGLNHRLAMYVNTAFVLDQRKKEIRSKENHFLKIEVHPTKFDAELSDLFYYLNAVAIGRGLTIEDLARMGYEKVLAKRGQVKEGDPAR